MKINIEVPVGSNLKPSKSPFIFKYKEDTFELICRQVDTVDFIRVARNVDARNEDYINEFKRVREELNKNSEIFPIHSIEQRMINSLKLLEYVLFDECDLRIKWDRLGCNYITENNEEEELRKTGQICGGWGQIIHVKKPATIEDPQAITCRLEYSEGLEIELAFFKQANIAIKERNYIEAFFNLYLILESYYSGGKRRNQGKIFKDNKELNEIIEELICVENFRNNFKKSIPNNKLTAKNIIERLVKTRGRIFHFLDITNPQRNVTYDTQEQYKNEVFALRGIIWRAMRKRFNKCKNNSSRAVKNNAHL